MARKIIDRVFAVEDHAQVRSQMGTRSTGERKRGDLANRAPSWERKSLAKDSENSSAK